MKMKLKNIEKKDKNLNQKNDLEKKDIKCNQKRVFVLKNSCN